MPIAGPTMIIASRSTTSSVNVWELVQPPGAANDTGIALANELPDPPEFTTEQSSVAGSQSVADAAVADAAVSAPGVPAPELFADPPPGLVAVVWFAAPPVPTEHCVTLILSQSEGNGAFFASRFVPSGEKVGLLQFFTSTD